METFSTRQDAAIASANKIAYWDFRIIDTNDNIYYWSTGTRASSGNETVTVGALEAPGVWTDNEWERSESFKIINFSGITLRRSKSESGIHAPNDVSFTITNPSNTLTATDFIGGTVRIGLVLQDGTAKELCGSWRFRIKSASPYSQQIDVVGEDFMQEYMYGGYPNKRLISDIFPVTDGTAPDNLCVPEVYGTCYIPLRSVYVSGDDRYYLLGGMTSDLHTEITPTYTISEVRSPRVLGAKIVWTTAGFTFTQYTKADGDAVDWRVFQPLIADGNSGVFLSGSRILDVPTKFSRSDTVSVTSPADVLRAVLRNMGAKDYDIDIQSFEDAKTIFTGWGLTWNFAFWYKEDRTKVLSRLLAMCNSCLVIGEQIKLKVLVKASQKTITDSEVLKMQEVGQDTFRYSDSLAEKASDSGYVAFQQEGESQDEFLKVLVPAKTTTAVIDQEVITFPGVQDSQDAQALGTLYYQRKFLKRANVSFMAKGTCLALRPDDVITINYADYGGNYAVLVEEIKINPDVSLEVSAIRFTVALDDFDDLAPGAITIATDDPTTTFTPVIGGPDVTPTSGSMPNALPGRLRVGQTTSYIVLEPATPLRMSVYSAATEVIRIGNLNGFLGYASALYGLAIGDATDYMKYDPTNGLRLSGALEAGTLDIGGADASSFHVDISGNMWLGAATYNQSTNPFCVSAAGALRAASGVIAGFTIDPSAGFYSGSGATRVQMQPATGIWAGATTLGAAPFRVTSAGAMVATSSTVTGTVTATTGSSLVGTMIGTVTATGGYIQSMTLGSTGIVSGTLTLQLSDGTGDTYINSGKTDFTNAQTGFILGIDDSDANTPKFYIGSATKYLNWDGTDLTITGATIDEDASGTSADAFTVNSDVENVNADLVLGRTTGGSATLRWNGTIVTIDKEFAATVGLHVGGTSAAGDNNLLVDGTGTIVGAFGCNAASAQTAYASSGSLVSGIRTNFLYPSADIGSATWSKSAGGTGVAPVITSAFAEAPDGTTTAARMQFDRGVGTTSGDYSLCNQNYSGFDNPHPSSGFLWLRTNDATTRSILFYDGYGATNTAVVTGSWQKFFFSHASIASTFSQYWLNFRGDVGSDSTADLLAWGGQFEVSTTSSSLITTVSGAVSYGDVSDIYALVITIRAALVANGIMW